MIKLNNKNITYVALADTNNSIKAPKEIWYADSANSVKLVYRRKDALIEGEDYEKYHWLEGDGTAYIDTGVTSYTGVVDIKLSVGSFRGIIFGRARRNDEDYSERFFVGRYTYYGIYGNNQVPSVLKVNDSVLLTIDIDNSIATDNYGNTTSISIIGNVVGNSMYLFCANKDNVPVTPIFNGKIGLFNISSIINLIPCKLLKPVPKWLDANGIRRNIGECGMIDLVSGKFYGNVNSSGTFTVENYYERKEWLVGDGSAYIKIKGYTRNEYWTIRTKCRVRGAGKSDTYPQMYGAAYYNNIYGSWALFAAINITTIKARSSSPSSYHDNYFDYNYNDVISIIDEHNSVSINNISKSTIADRVYFDNDEFWLFSSYDNRYMTNNPASRIADADFSDFIVYESGINILNLIPCTLTMDLPASMDANNIARTKGTSGMWDLVSDRFYGNVANSGTFKAVNLAEGVDYEVHQWLKTGSGYPHIQVAYDYNTDSGAYIETRYKCNYSNRGFDMFIGFSANQNNNIGIRIFNAENKTFVDHHKTENGVLSSSRIIKSQSNINAERYIKVTLNNLIIDDTEYSTINWGSGFDDIDRRGTILYTNQGDNDVHYAETKLRVNNVEYDLIPVKLLRSIPSKYDANGIARQAGECGMYDTVNDVFYGNVASSGAFTVEPSLVEGVDYERHKWLKGDGSAYLYLGEVQNYIEFDVDLQQEVKTNVFIYGLNGQVRYGTDGQTISVLAPENRIKYYNVPLQGTIRIDFSTHYVYFNGEQFGHTDLGTVKDLNDENCYKKAYFFGFEQLPSFRSRYVSLGKVNMDGSNIIPVKLLRSIPSKYDANGIARQVGECGMYDTVNDVFYGNVASSGSFTVSDDN